MPINLDDIAEAFPPGPPWTDRVTGCPPEIIGLERGLRGWPDVTTKFCNRNSDAYNMLDLEPLAYFLPAFLRAAIDDSKGVAAEDLVSFVCSGHAHDLHLRLSREQRDVMLGVVASILDHDDGYFASAEREQFARRLREWSVQ